MNLDICKPTQSSPDRVSPEMDPHGPSSTPIGSFDWLFFKSTNRTYPTKFYCAILYIYIVFFYLPRTSMETLIFLYLNWSCLYMLLIYNFLMIILNKY